VALSPTEAGKRRKTRIVIVRMSDVQTPTFYQQWFDPAGLAPMSREKLAALSSNPMRRGDDEPVQLLGLLGDEVIGRLDLIAGALVVDDHTLPLSWASAFTVLPEMRHTLIGLKLVREIQRLNLVVAACGISKMAYPIYKRFGWIDFVMPRYILLRHSRPVIERSLHPRAALTAARVIDTLLAMYTKCVLRGTNGLIELRLDTSVTPELARTIRCSRNTFMPRSAETLNWRLRSSFRTDQRNRNFLLTLTSHGEIVGYALLKLRYHAVASARGFRDVMLGSVQEWLIFNSRLLCYRTLITMACRELIRHNVDAVEVCAATDEEAFVLRRMGMKRVGEQHLMWYPSPGTRIASTEYRQQSNWMIRSGEGDDFFS